MLRVRFGTTAVVITVLAAALILSVSGSVGVAQEPAGCPALIDAVLEVVRESCGDLPSGEVCYGSGPITLTRAGGEGVFAEAGDTVALAEVNTLTTGAPDPERGAWGVAVMRATADLPAEAEQTMTMILFGEAAITNLVDPNAEAAPTITLQNSAGYPVNLRVGAGTGFPVGGTLEEDVPVVADGVNANGDWYRVQVETGLLWVFRDLVSVVGGEASALRVRADNDILPAYSQPWQAFALTTAAGDPVCGGASGGLLIQLEGEEAVHIQINGADLTFSSATLLVQQASAGAMDILVLDGAVSVNANGIGVSAEAGAWIELLLDGATNPVVHQAYRFAAADGVPIDLLPTGMACTTGLLSPDAEVTLYAGPGDAYGVLTQMDPELHYLVDGQLVDDQGTAWWRLNIAGYARAWVQQSEVHAVGLCGEVAEVAAPPLTAGPAGGTGGSGLVPAGQSVWQSDPGLDNMSGTCTGPAIAVCAHLVAIQPNSDGSISWRGQEPQAYTLSPAGENTYSFNGRNHLGSGNLQMTLTFTSESTWSMTHTTVYDNDPGCQHTFYYTATRSW